MLISVFKNARSTDPESLELDVFLQSKRHIPTIDQVRQQEDKKKRDELKKNLPAATISGTFKKREIHGIQMYNGLVCLDFDGKDNPDFTPDQMRNILASFQETYYCGLSVSGSGVYAIIRTDNDDPQRHSEIVESLGNLIHTLSGIQYDKACKDVCRLRFVSYDNEAYINRNCAAFPAKRELERIDKLLAARPPRPIKVYRSDRHQSNDTTRKKVESYIEAIESSRTDITSDYQDWCNLGFALASEFGMDGEDYFQRISQFNPKYSASDTEKKYSNLLRTSSGRVTIGTFFSICNSNGIRI
jgi:hypothetical protein